MEVWYVGIAPWVFGRAVKKPGFLAKNLKKPKNQVITSKNLQKTCKKPSKKPKNLGALNIHEGRPAPGPSLHATVRARCQATRRMHQ